MEREPKDRILAMFPLPIMLLPGEQTQLHIYEDRYKELLHDIESERLQFGIPFTDKNHTLKYGVIVNLVKVDTRYPDGAMDILIEATDLFEVSEYNNALPGKNYPGGKIQLVNYNDHKILSPYLKKLFTAFARHFYNKDDVLNYVHELKRYEMASLISLDNKEKLKFIGLSPAEQERFMVRKLNYLLLLINQEKRVQNNIYLN